MLFVIIFIITIISIFYIFQNIKHTNYLQNKSRKLKSPQLLFVIVSLFIFFLSSSIYYKIGNPFINMEELNASKLKLIQSKNIKNNEKNSCYWIGLRGVCNSNCYSQCKKKLFLHIVK